MSKIDILKVMQKKWHYKSMIWIVKLSKRRVMMELFEVSSWNK